MLDDFSSDKIFMQMEAKKAAVQAISDTKKQLELAKEELKNAELALSDVDKAERMALSDLGDVRPIQKFFSTLFKRGKYYEYQQKSKELSTQREKAKTVVDEARRNVSDAESKHDEAIKTNDNTKDASKVYEKTDKGLLITDVSLGKRKRLIPKKYRVHKKCLYIAQIFFLIQVK